MKNTDVVLKHMASKPIGAVFTSFRIKDEIGIPVEDASNILKQLSEHNFLDVANTYGLGVTYRINRLGTDYSNAVVNIYAELEKVGLFSDVSKHWKTAEELGTTDEFLNNLINVSNLDIDNRLAQPRYKLTSAYLNRYVIKDKEVPEA